MTIKMNRTSFFLFPLFSKPKAPYISFSALFFDDTMNTYLCPASDRWYRLLAVILQEVISWNFLLHWLALFFGWP